MHPPPTGRRLRKLHCSSLQSKASDTYEVVFSFGYISIIWAKFLMIDLERSLIVQLHLMKETACKDDTITIKRHSACNMASAIVTCFF